MKRKLARKGKAQQPAPKPAPAQPDHEELMAGEELDASDEGLRDAESQLGISEWIDPDTGAPAEDSVPRIEDH